MLPIQSYRNINETKTLQANFLFYGLVLVLVFVLALVLALALALILFL